MKITFTNKKDTFGIESTSYDTGTDSFNFLISTGDVFSMIEKLKSVGIDCSISTSGIQPTAMDVPQDERGIELEFESKDVEFTELGIMKCTESNEEMSILYVEQIDGKVIVNESVISLSEISEPYFFFTHVAKTGESQKVKFLLKEDAALKNTMSIPKDFYKTI